MNNVVVLDNPSPFYNPFQFEITFECIEDLSEGEWRPPPPGCQLRLQTLKFPGPGLARAAALGAGRAAGSALEGNLKLTDDGRRGAGGVGRGRAPAAAQLARNLCGRR